MQAEGGGRVKRERARACPPGCTPEHSRGSTRRSSPDDGFLARAEARRGGKRRTRESRSIGTSGEGKKPSDSTREHVPVNRALARLDMLHFYLPIRVEIAAT